MSFAPYAAIWVLMVAAAGIALLLEQRPKWVVAISLIIPLLAIALWYFFRPEATTPSLSFIGRQWTVGDAAWSLTGTVLLLALTVAVWAAIQPGPPFTGLRMATAQGLPAAVLPAVWAADDRTRLLGMTLFAAVWVVSRLAAFASDADSARTNGREIFMTLAFLFPLWAAYSVPGGRVLLSVIAAILIIAAGSRHYSKSNIGWVVSSGISTIAATAILIAALGTGSLSPIGVVAGTIAGMLALMLGLTWAWVRPQMLAAALSLALGGVVFLAAVWAGQAAILSATRLAVFVPALVALAAASQIQGASQAVPLSAPSDSPRRRLSPQWLVFLLAYVTVAGLPPTVGFGALMPIYESWRGMAGWVLLLVVVILLTLWLATLYQTGRAAARAATGDKDEWMVSLSYMPPAIGLIALDLSGLTASWVTWAAVAVPFVAGAMLGHFAPDMGSLGDLLREATALPQSAVQIRARLRTMGGLVDSALADALAILEGENGLIWLLGLLLLIIWIS